MLLKAHDLAVLFIALMQSILTPFGTVDYFIRLQQLLVRRVHTFEVCEMGRALVLLLLERVVTWCFELDVWAARSWIVGDVASTAAVVVLAILCS